MPTFLQVVTGASATGSGLLLLPLLIAATAATTVSGRVISRTGRYKVFPVAGLALMSVGLLLLSRMTAGTSQATASLLLVVFGLGFGMVAQVLTLAIQNTVDRRDIGIATGSANLFRSLGGSVGVAVFGALFAARLDTASIDPERLQASPEAIASMPAAVQDAIASAVAHALDTVFLVAAPVAALGLLVVLFLKEVPLRGPGGPKPGPREAPARPDQATEVAA
jgi:MFS family permease